MKKFAIGHMHPEKRGFLSFWKRIHIVQLLLCLVLAVILWLLVVNLGASTTQADTQAELSRTASDALVHAL